MRFMKTTIAALGIITLIATYESPWPKAPAGHSITDYVKEVGQVVDKKDDDILIDCEDYYLHTKADAKGQVYIGGTLAGESLDTDIFDHNRQDDELRGWNSARKPFDKPVYRIFNATVSKDRETIESCLKKGLTSFGDFHYHEDRWNYTVRKGECAVDISQRFNEQDTGDFRRELDEIHGKDIYFKGKPAGNMIYPGQEVYIPLSISSQE